MVGEHKGRHVDVIYIVVSYVIFNSVQGLQPMSCTMITKKRPGKDVAPGTPVNIEQECYPSDITLSQDNVLKNIFSHIFGKNKINSVDLSLQANYTD
jgi:hypothetical protein